jgi:hypothetical protein
MKFPWLQFCPYSFSVQYSCIIIHPASLHLLSFNVIISLIDDLTNQAFIGMLVIGDFSQNCVNSSDNEVDDNNTE